MNVDNAIEANFRKLTDSLTNEYEDLYDSFHNSKLRILFSTLHAKLINLFDSMNERLPTGDCTAHFWAESSRELISSIEIIESLERSLKKSKYAFTLDDKYGERIILCKTFLSKSGGSEIPANIEKMEIYYTISIFKQLQSITIENQKNNYDLKLIGEGSYAKVFSYHDQFYKKNFALKRAKENLSTKEISRFKREYEQMKILNSPYVLEVFGYNDNKNEYIMEFMNLNLDQYISKNNVKLSFDERFKLGLQVIKAFTYVHSKDILHRDICPKNLLVKEYDDVIIIKVADFGLIKVEESQLTSLDTDCKGYFNDPNLRLEGFSNYNILHETYALTRILYFILSGKIRTDRPSQNLQNFINKGINSDQRLRFKDMDELKEAFQKIKSI